MDIPARLSVGVIVCVSLSGLVGGIDGNALGSQRAAETTKSIVIKTLSSRPDRVSGGDVLVQVDLPPAAATRGTPAVTVNGRNASSMFRRGTTPNSLVGLVTGLSVGRNVLHVAGKSFGARDASLELTNYPSTGPIISGPHVQPFVCQTDRFKLPDGSTLGPPSDSDCSAPMRVQYVYMAKGAKELEPLPNSTTLPPDTARTTTRTGAVVPFVVRVETGTMNRGIYQNLILHDPTRDPAPSPFARLPAWNGGLIAIHGVGCPSGWYRQGAVMGVNPLTGANITRLGEGYALFTNTLNHPTNSCNAFLAGETTMMGKEHFIETFGVPDFTISMGSSGGAYTSLQIADEFPGLFDGVLVNATFPDALSIALSGMDAHLLAHYFASDGASELTESQRTGITGYAGIKAFMDAANQSQRTDPVSGRVDIDGYTAAAWNDAVPRPLRYDPTTNPSGARPTVFDAARNVYGVDRSGYGLRPFDNVGVQYGLGALRSGTITAKQFLDLNERIGGYDRDANYMPSRSVGDEGAIKRAYQAGLTLGGGGGLASIPVLDSGAYREDGGYHYQWFHFAVRERMKRQNGAATNHVLWRGPVQAEPSWQAIVKWVQRVNADHSDVSQRDKVIANRPPEVVDGCWTAAHDDHPAEFIAEPQTFGRQSDSRCNQQYPSHAFARFVAGGPLDANILRCQLKPADMSDYSVGFTPSEAERLRRVFPQGVCDWSKPGVNQMPVVPWASFGPAPERRVLDALQSTR